MGAADWTRARVGGELIPIQGTAVVDLLETFGTKQTSGSRRQEQVSRDASSHIPVQDTDKSTSSGFKARPWHPVNGICHHPCSSKQIPRALQQLSVAPSQGSARRAEKVAPPYCICWVPAASLHCAQQGCFANHLLYSPVVWGWRGSWCCWCSRRSRVRCIPWCFPGTPGGRSA